MKRNFIILFLLFVSFSNVSIAEKSEILLPECVGPSNWTNCKGVYTLESGSEYIGGFKEDQFHGQGTLTYKDGRKYIGEFRWGEYHGQGTLTYADGRIDNGIWNFGKLAKSNKAKTEIAKKKAKSKKQKLEQKKRKILQYQLLQEQDFLFHLKDI